MAQILIALPIFTQQHQMIGIIINAMDAVFHSAACNIDLTADNRLNSGCFGSLIEIDAAIHDTVVGDCNGSLPKLLHTLHHAVYAASSIQ